MVNYTLCGIMWDDGIYMDVAVEEQVIGLQSTVSLWSSS